MVSEAARQGDETALAEIGGVANSIGLALANVITLFHPERIALGGGLCLMGDILLDPIRTCVDEHLFGPFRGRYDIVPCELEKAVVIVGALLLAPNEENAQWYRPRDTIRRIPRTSSLSCLTVESSFLRCWPLPARSLYTC